MCGQCVGGGCQHHKTRHLISMLFLFSYLLYKERASRLNQVETYLPLSSETSPMATTIFLSIIISLLFLAHGGIAQQQDPLPVQLPQVAIEGGNDGTCPSAEVAANSTKEEIRSILRDTVVPLLSDRTRCPCGGPGLWRRIVHLNMSDHNQQCPPNWMLQSYESMHSKLHWL